MDVTSMRVMKIEIDGGVVEISDVVKERLLRAIYDASNLADAVLDIPSLFFIITLRNRNIRRAFITYHQNSCTELP